jgi:hypothetical protein
MMKHIHGQTQIKECLDKKETGLKIVWLLIYSLAISNKSKFIESISA